MFNTLDYIYYDDLKAKKFVMLPSKVSNKAFLEELIVRKELSDNFCYYNMNYDNVHGFPAWAEKTLKDHRDDPRDYLYSLDEFERGKTHDDLWNAAQLEMLHREKCMGI